MNSLKAVSVYDVATVQELETFTKRPNGTWSKISSTGIYDDRVMALVWALFALFNVIAESIFEVVQYDDNGKPLKISKGYYDEDANFALDQYKRSYGDDELTPVFIGTKSGMGTNIEMEDMLCDGWSMFDQNQLR
jgi:hypothetical protein